jgi:RNA polymerase sigma-70 factor (ECF subfamily)
VDISVTEGEASRHGEGGAVRPALSPSFRELFLNEFDFVERSLIRLGVREADANDIAQEIFISVHSALPDFEDAGRDRGPSKVRAWLFSYAVRFAANYRRLGWHRGGVLDERHPLPSPRTHKKLEARQLVAHGLEALGFEQRVALVMHDMEGISAPEIAEELGVPMNTVYSRVRLARQTFRKAIESLESEATGV